MLFIVTRLCLIKYFTIQFVIRHLYIIYISPGYSELRLLEPISRLNGTEDDRNDALWVLLHALSTYLCPRSIVLSGKT